MRSEQEGRKRRPLVFILLSVFLVTILAVCIFISPEEMIENIGVRNGYLIALVVSFFAGFSAFTAVSYYTVLISFLSGGLNPYLLAVITGISLSLGDIFLFYVGRKGRDLLYGKAERAVNRMARFFAKHRLEKYIPLAGYIYISFIPLPNDWLLLFLASIRYPYRRMNLIIALGDLTHAALITFLVSQGILFFR